MTSPILKWPDARTVDEAVRRLAARLAAQHPELVHLGYFGSYARGDWGVGSDVDLLAVVAYSARPFAERVLDFDLSGLPVPAELLVYSAQEWQSLPRVQPHFATRMAREVVWVWPPQGGAGRMAASA
ncbi:MAG: nucleotidyltransferase domain-containing protein [Thiobacillaceae bacterium]|nr:nucleotidyltransferase domain-containing protein [Thiobacillaceae bacterium]